MDGNARQPDLLERDAFQRRYRSRVAAMRSIADSNCRQVDIRRQLLRNLRHDIGKGSCGLDSEAKLPFSALEPQNHGGERVVVGAGM